MGFWWNQTNDDFSITPSGIKWGSIQSIYRIEGFVTPKDFDREHSCPPAIGYDTSWNESTEVAMTFHRVEGSTVEYHCNEPYKIEGMDQETFEGEAVCRRATAGGELTWSKIPKLPCRLICREGYSPNGDGKECLRFSNERAQFGLSSASLKCSRDGASLARITSIKDMESAHEGRTYYTAHVRVGNETVFEGPPAGEVSCDAASSCQADNVSRCLTVTKVSSSVSTQKFGNCEDANYYACSLPGRCPKGFFQHRGLCYRLLSLHSRLNFLRALEKCGEIGSGLVYPETKEDLDFVKNLTLVRVDFIEFWVMKIVLE
ncbi:uncharacterized protein [Macrobrachium rosenbergii]|uniref:uncharacterized protein n=1 Tax=Macrobrachium rosenbergii TaxID=79674 RepID=UPI0034D50356